jgi:hypothetical protein
VSFHGYVRSQTPNGLHREEIASISFICSCSMDAHQYQVIFGIVVHNGSVILQKAQENFKNTDTLIHNCFY